MFPTLCYDGRMPENHTGIVSRSSAVPTLLLMVEMIALLCLPSNGVAESGVTAGGGAGDGGVAVDDG